MKFLLIFAFLCINQQAISQTLITGNIQNEKLKEKSHSQNATAWILAVSGTGMLIAGGCISYSNSVQSIQNIWVPNREQVETTNAGEVVAIIGLVTAAASVPFFISAAKNKRKAHAAAVSIKLNDPLVLQDQNLTRVKVPALSLSIPILHQLKSKK